MFPGFPQTTVTPTISLFFNQSHRTHNRGRIVYFEITQRDFLVLQYWRMEENVTITLSNYMTFIMQFRNNLLNINNFFIHLKIFIGILLGYICFKC